jgi:AraC family transcriptional regulator of arabinose operon
MYTDARSVYIRDSLIDFRICKVLQSIEHNPAQTIQELAKLVNLSSSRLSHLFKAQTGMSLKAFLGERRLDLAAQMLRTTDMRIKEITYTVGYCQEPSFDRAFRKRFLCNPTDYRIQQRRILLRDSRFG